MLNVSIQIIFMRNMTEVTIVNLRKLTIGLRLHPMGAFDYTTNGVTMHAHSCMTQLTSMTSWYKLTHNTPKHFQTCHKIVPYKTVDI